MRFAFTLLLVVGCNTMTDHSDAPPLLLAPSTTAGATTVANNTPQPTGSVDNAKLTSDIGGPEATATLTADSAGELTKTSNASTAPVTNTPPTSTLAAQTDATSGPSSSSTANTASTVTTTSGTIDTVDVCECYRQQLAELPSRKACVVDLPGQPQEPQCAVAADCCPETLPEGFVCNRDYPYLYECEASRCVARSCAVDDECRASAPAEATGHKCSTLEIACSDTPLRYCEYDAPTTQPATGTCTVAADCCPETMPEGFVCNRDYPYLYECAAGVCTSRQCSESSQCDAYFGYIESLGTFQNLGCVTTTDKCTMTAYASCQYQAPAACQTENDCCPDALLEGFVCNRDYPYIYQCNDGTCATASCSNDDQCDAYFDFLGSTEAINRGCQAL